MSNAINLKHLFVSSDNTKKYLWETSDKHFFETVLVNLEYRLPNYVICVSTQIGCPVRCAFCRTGMRYVRNLEKGEIISQIQQTVKLNPLILQLSDHKKFEVSFMAMGEPLLNWEGLLSSLIWLQEQYRENINVTISTVGIIPQIYKLSKEHFVYPIDLQISLHAIRKELRDKLIPFGSNDSIDDLIFAGEYYAQKTKRKVCINYLLFRGINDDIESAELLSKKLNPRYFYIKLSFPLTNDINFKPSHFHRVKEFQEILSTANIETKIFKSRGIDINAGCGQLSLSFYNILKHKKLDNELKQCALVS